jgi:hypothetical protein
MTTPSSDPNFTKAEYEIKLLLHKPKFQNGVIAIRKKWNIPFDGFPDNPAGNVWREELGEDRLPEYKEDIYLLMRELRLAERWYQGVSYYIQDNNPAMLRVQSPNAIRLQFDGSPLDRKNVRSVWVQVDADTTKDEMVEAFKYARDLFDVPKRKKQQPENLDRDLALLERHRRGVKNKELALWLTDNYDGAFNTDDVKSILKRIKHRLS